MLYFLTKENIFGEKDITYVINSNIRRKLDRITL
jgi:hypothetical protein